MYQRDQILQLLKSKPNKWWSANQISKVVCATAGMPTSIRVHLCQMAGKRIDKKIGYRRDSLKKYVWFRARANKRSIVIKGNSMAGKKKKVVKKQQKKELSLADVLKDDSSLKNILMQSIRKPLKECIIDFTKSKLEELVQDAGERIFLKGAEFKQLVRKEFEAQVKAELPKIVKDHIRDMYLTV